MQTLSFNLLAVRRNTRIYVQSKKCNFQSQQVCRIKDYGKTNTCPSVVINHKGSLVRLRSKVWASPLPVVGLITDEWIKSVSDILLACLKGCISSMKSDDRSFQHETPAPLVLHHVVRSCTLRRV